MSMILSRIAPAGAATSTVSPFLWPIRARPTGDSLESRPGSRVGFGRSDDLVGVGVAVVDVLDAHLRSDRHDVGGDVLGVDHPGRPKLFLEARDPMLQQRLLVLGVVVLGVLGDVSELARLPDPISNLATPGCFEFFDLRLEPLVAFWGEDYVLFHADVLSWGPSGLARKHERCRPRVCDLQHFSSGLTPRNAGLYPFPCAPQTSHSSTLARILP